MTSMIKKTLIYLGLGPDEEYERQGDFYGEPTPAVGDAEPARPAGAAQATLVRPSPSAEAAARTTTGTVRPLNSTASADTGPTVRPLPLEPDDSPRSSASSPKIGAAPSGPSPAIRTLGPASAAPSTVSPTSFNDAQTIGDKFKAGQPVIVNLEGVDRDLRRRLVDFASGLCYALGGKMDRVAVEVYLLSPLDVEVSEDETRRALD